MKKIKSISKYDVDEESSWPDSIHQEFSLAKKIVYDACGYSCSYPKAEAESSDYEAYRFKINRMSVIYRLAKITPTKTGQFVTLWKRNENGPIEPFDTSDDIDLIIISARYKNNFGQFIFPKSILLARGIISDNGNGGKRAMRIYPPWNKVKSRLAQKTQQWQLEYFLEIDADSKTDLRLARKIFREQ